MSRIGLIAILLAGCGTNPPTPDADQVPQVCQDATMHSDLTWIEANIFVKQCAFSGCHNGGATLAGHVDLRAGMSHDHLVNFPSQLDPSRMLVVPGDPAKSYLLVMIGQMDPHN